MPTPTPGDLHVSTPLTNISIAYMQDETKYIASRAFANIPVQKQYDTFYKYDKGDWFRTDVQRRAPGAESTGSGWNITTDTYAADVWAVHVDIDDQLRANADSTFNLDRDATMNVTNQLLLRRDKEWIARYFTTSVWDTNITGVDSAPSTNQTLRWNVSTSSPITDIWARSTDIEEKTGYRPNILIVGSRVYQVLVNHPEVIARVQYVLAGGAFLTTQIIAQAFGLDDIVVARAIENTAVENKALTNSMNFMAGKHALLLYRNPNPGLLMPSAGYTFSWSGYLGAGDAGNRIKRFRIEERAADRIEGEMAFSLKVISTDLAAFFNTIVA